MCGYGQPTQKRLHQFVSSTFVVSHWSVHNLHLNLYFVQSTYTCCDTCDCGCCNLVCIHVHILTKSDVQHKLYVNFNMLSVWSIMKELRHLYLVILYLVIFLTYSMWCCAIYMYMYLFHTNAIHLYYLPCRLQKWLHSCPWWVQCCSSESATWPSVSPLFILLCYLFIQHNSKQCKYTVSCRGS